MVNVSSGIPNRGGLRAISRIVASHEEPYTFVTISYTTDELDNKVETETEYTENVWFYRDEIRLVQELVGERTVGGINALTTAPTSIEEDDRVTYDGVEYDVLVKHELPSNNPSVVLLELDRRQDAQ